MVYGIFPDVYTALDSFLGISFLGLVLFMIAENYKHEKIAKAGITIAFVSFMLIVTTAALGLNSPAMG